MRRGPLRRWDCRPGRRKRAAWAAGTACSRPGEGESGAAWGLASGMGHDQRRGGSRRQRPLGPALHGVAAVLGFLGQPYLDEVDTVSKTGFVW